jgi:hypothetical protein
MCWEQFRRIKNRDVLKSTGDREPIRKVLKPASLEKVPSARTVLLPSESVATEDDEARFFSSLRLKNGTYKITRSHRLDNLNDLVNQLVPRRHLKVMDVAVSSGTTTLEWIQALHKAGIDHEMTAGDSFMFGFIVSIGNNLHILTDKSGHPLQFEVFRETLPIPLPGKRALLKNLVPLLLGYGGLNLLFNTMGTPRSSNIPGLVCRPVTLLSQRLKQQPNIRLIEDDILAGNAFSAAFDIVRAANILNRDYFDEVTLKLMLANLRARLTRNGLLVVCKTDNDGTNRASVFALRDGGPLEVVARLGAGSDIEDLAIR